MVRVPLCIVVALEIISGKWGILKRVMVVGSKDMVFVYNKLRQLLWYGPVLWAAAQENMHTLLGELTLNKKLVYFHGHCYA